jgi:hypothetical protein
MSDKFDFIKVQPSNGVMKDKNGNIVAFVWIFRPDVAVEDRHYFKMSDTDDDSNFLCIETGSDKIPVNCKKIFSPDNRPNEWESVGDEEILKCFEFCCSLLAEKYKDIELQQLGHQILLDTLSGDKK